VSLGSLSVRLDPGAVAVHFAAALFSFAVYRVHCVLMVFFFLAAPPPYKGGGGRGGIITSGCIFVHLLFSPPSVLYMAAKIKTGRNKGAAVQIIYFRHQAFYIWWRK
jgi:hypothetical protein